MLIKTGYDLSFKRYFCKLQPLRSLEAVRTDILALEQETEGLLDEIVGGEGLTRQRILAIHGIEFHNYIHD